MTSTIPNIVIIGGGAGGLELATQLGHKLGKKQRANILLIDKNRNHIWKPLLHEVATGSLDSNIDGVVYSAHAAKHGYRFQLGCFSDLDSENKTITLAAELDDNGQQILPSRQVSYDQLVIAIGSVCNDFGTPGVQEHCYFLDSHKQADRFHHALLDSFTRMHQQEQQTALDIAIVGAGATGVELSAELYHVADLLKIYGLSNMTAKKLNIHLIEAGPTILPALPPRISASAKAELEKIGVNVMQNTRISEASCAGFITSEGELIEADLMLWAAGVKAPDFVKDLGHFELNRANQIVVKENLKSTTDDNIYVIGDCCSFDLGDGQFVPPRAQSAHQMASCVEKNIIAELKGASLVNYQYTDYGSLVNLSRFSTVGSLMGNLTSSSMFVEGKIARLVYISLYRMHQRAIHGTLKTVGLWFAEKIMKVVRPRMKLH
ncbi:NAD(P)/FAD-dependent oxidoreductase [Psychrobium sp. 1_MG-2023]|uniref:NAD(P)/FAD-dependent oxidoreductase n=1 Tax=Psychrobium sp. 1_MG-2023 TaxID=3062624 RepID=UPI000C32CC1D|nr:NAD(P)/FAD-dependent oxidoreductase [Psychrobium sp. 1_MG-2023]MDP2562803.1 NAD(P)/FAD-dependent oxidoreductase [Psychrobium sp. 1_MG-2023]PKF54448.1 FAD-dependent oxidoreductase [Alteromonadales bacterium alter-6D02]